MTLGSTVLQNELKKRLGTEFLDRFPSGSAIAYTLIPQIDDLSEPIKSDVQAAFAQSLSIFWKVLIGIGAMGILSSLLMKGLALHSQLDEQWALEQNTVEMQSQNKPGSVVQSDAASDAPV